MHEATANTRAGRRSGVALAHAAALFIYIFIEVLF